MKLQNLRKLSKNAELSKKRTLPISGQNHFPQWCPLIKDYTVKPENKKRPYLKREKRYNSLKMPLSHFSNPFCKYFWSCISFEAQRFSTFQFHLLEQMVSGRSERVTRETYKDFVGLAWNGP